MGLDTRLRRCSTGGWVTVDRLRDEECVERAWIDAIGHRCFT
jgi:hypothetical protein